MSRSNKYKETPETSKSLDKAGLLEKLKKLESAPWQLVDANECANVYSDSREVMGKKPPIRQHEAQASAIYENMITLEKSQDILLENERSGEPYLLLVLILVGLLINDELDFAEMSGRIIGKVIIYIFIVCIACFSYYRKTTTQ